MIVFGFFSSCPLYSVCVWMYGMYVCLEFTGNVAIFIFVHFILHSRFRGTVNTELSLKSRVPIVILKLQILTQLRVAGGRQGRRNYWKGIVNLVNVKHHTKTTKHAKKVEEDTSWPHSRHHH